MATRWIGREKLRRRLERLPELAKQHVRAGLQQAAEETVGMMKRAAPVGKAPIHLRDAIHYTWGRPGKKILGAFNIGGGDGIALTIRASSPNVTYAHLVEFGTAPHAAGGKFKGAMHPGTPAQPFFWPSYRAMKRRIRTLVRRGLKRAVAASAGA